MIEPFGRFSSDRRPKEEKADLTYWYGDLHAPTKSMYSA
jgi:hypothetical protein